MHKPIGYQHTGSYRARAERSEAQMRTMFTKEDVLSILQTFAESVWTHLKDTDQPWSDVEEMKLHALNESFLPSRKES
jgi:hypothetical protein